MQHEPQEMEPTMDGQKKDSEKRCQIRWKRKGDQKKGVRSDGQEKIRPTKQMKKMGKQNHPMDEKSEMDALHHTPRGEMTSILTDQSTRVMQQIPF